MQHLIVEVVPHDNRHASQLGMHSISIQISGIGYETDTGIGVAFMFALQ